jgi:HAD superfamily hydrolase (TIGR01509 family)
VKQAVLFDLDGVLLETEPLKARAHSTTTAHFGATVPPIFYANVMGMVHAEVRSAFMHEGGIAPGPDEYSRVFREHYQRLVETEVRTCAGVPDLIAALRREKFSIAVVTSSARWMLTGLLERMFGPNAFDTTISADDVAAHKPAPDCYRKALANLQPDRAVAFEDTVTGVSAAVAAKLPVIAVRHGLNANHDLSQASVILPGLEETATVMETVHKMLSWR